MAPVKRLLFHAPPPSTSTRRKQQPNFVPRSPRLTRATACFSLCLVFIGCVCASDRVHSGPLSSPKQTPGAALPLTPVKSNASGLTPVAEVLGRLQDVYDMPERSSVSLESSATNGPVSPLEGAIGGTGEEYPRAENRPGFISPEDGQHLGKSGVSPTSDARLPRVTKVPSFSDLTISSRLNGFLALYLLHYPPLTERFASRECGRKLRYVSLRYHAEEVQGAPSYSGDVSPANRLW
ncbi:hypothetical protein CSUI_003782 [Cystoisospora suis]|uniref:Uncharacterized protein n=1 Tax=Cystoisospora suis TaxID=483139 RepID=A0A2C6L3M5_9APIC|nr:hypothetical protein CSUI_003782 [Cystoisospora suis]